MGEENHRDDSSVEIKSFISEKVFSFLNKNIKCFYFLKKVFPFHQTE